MARKSENTSNNKTMVNTLAASKAQSELQGMVVRMSRELTRHNPRVQAIALRMRWRSETLITRVKEALPSPVEQHIYLRIARSIRLLPESMRKILRYHLGATELQPSDLIDRQIGPGVVSNKFTDTMDFLETVLLLLKKVTTDLNHTLSITDAAKLTALYGEYAEALLDSIASSINKIREHLKLSRVPNQIIFAIAVKLIIRHAERRGAPCVSNVMDLFDEIEYAQDEILRLLNEENEDE